VPTEIGYQNELLARDVVAKHLDTVVEHTGACSANPDLLIHHNYGEYEIEVTLAVEQWRMDQQGALFQGDGFELCEIPDMPVSLWIQLGPKTHINTLNAVATQMSELVETSGIDWVHSLDYYQADGEADFWNITQEHQRLLQICRDLDLCSMQKFAGTGQLVRLRSGSGGSWDGGPECFNEWLTSYIESDRVQKKIVRALKLASGPLGLFIWLDSSVSYGAHEWLDRGRGLPVEIDLEGLGLKELWVASLHAPHSFVYLSKAGWHASHLGSIREPWFARHQDDHHK
jgi:hypothetical protein